MKHLKKIHWAIGILLIQLLMTAVSFAQTPQGTHQKKFSNSVYFWEYLPPGFDPSDITTKYPLMIFLHGAGERGSSPLSFTTLDKVLLHGPPYEINKGANMCFSVNGQPEKCFIVLSPQRDTTGYSWTGITENLMRYVDANLKLKVDPNMVYITGLSMGGIGTLDYIQSTRLGAKDFAAAAVAPGGGPDLNQKCVMVQNNIDFWAVHGKSDNTNGTLYPPMKRFIDSVNACVPAPNPPTLLYGIPGTGHNVWKDFYHTGVVNTYTPKISYSPNVYEWFLMNRKNGPNVSPNQKPIVSAGPNLFITGNSISIVGNAMDYDGVLESTLIEWSKVGSSSATWTQGSTVIQSSQDRVQRTISIANMTTNGSYTFRLTSTDNYGRTNTDDVTIIKGPNQNPNTTITSPRNGQRFLAPGSITITANATDVEADGGIVKVEFYAGATKIGEDVTAPYSYTWSNVAVGSYSITAKAFDNLGATTTSSPIEVAVVAEGSACSGTGQITREQWNSVSGSNVSDIPLTTPPSSVSQLTLFEGPTNIANSYGARIRGYICPPATGNYTFWIASDDKSELWLSTNNSPVNKARIAYVSGTTDVRQWEKDASRQKSVPIYLIAGHTYYIEALHKEGSGNDHVAVGWQLPNGTLERPIPGSRLLPYSVQPPTVALTSPTNGQTFTAPAAVSIAAIASSGSGSITKVEFFRGSTKIGEDATLPYSITWSNVAVGTYSITATATDNLGGIATSSPVSITVNTSSGCSASGTIMREVWEGIPGDDVIDIPLATAPTSTSPLTIFEAPSNQGSDYGARIRGYVCIPITGSYTFWISSDDDSELWLSTNENPDNKVRIARVSGYSSPRQWDKYGSQKSTPIQLTAGQRYYIEALHKEEAGGDHLAVGWELPDGTLERPIPGVRLSSYVETSCTASGTITREVWEGIPGDNVIDIPLATAPTSTAQLTIFEAPANQGSNYGARMRGYICAPETGNYKFWIACDDDGELWLSTDDNPSNKVRIAFVSGYTSVRQWDKYGAQESALIQLTAGQRYYIETLHKEEGGADHIAVGWMLPNGTLERPIPGSRLSPYTTSSGARVAINETAEENTMLNGSESVTRFYPNPVKDVIHLDGITNNANVNVFTTHGVLVLSNKVNRQGSTVSLNVEQLPSGMYYIVVQGARQQYRYKFWKE